MIAAGCGAVLLVSLWFDWYAADLGGAGEVFQGAELGLSAWQSFDVLDLLLFLTALGGIATLVVNATHRSPAIPVAVEVVATALACLALLGILYRLVNQPGPNDLIGVEPGAYLGFLLTAGIIYGAGRSMRDQAPRAADRPVPVEDLPAPPATAAEPAPPPHEGETEPAEGQGADPREPT